MSKKEPLLIKQVGWRTFVDNLAPTMSLGRSPKEEE
jgi:hypothetical protein